MSERKTRRHFDESFKRKAVEHKPRKPVALELGLLRDWDRDWLIALLQQHLQSRKTYGRPRLMIRLRRQGFHHGCNRIARLMREADISAR